MRFEDKSSSEYHFCHYLILSRRLGLYSCFPPAGTNTGFKDFLDCNSIFGLSVLANNLISATIGFQDIRYKVYVNDLFQNIFKLAAIVALFVLGFEVIGAARGGVLAIILTPFRAFYFAALPSCD